ncbi:MULTISPECIES: MFS transporter [Bacillus]|uniref:MFS transporter n=1 Tax=Bacillus TaxID=1386 RepID=UPI0002E312A3|nr:MULTISPECIES: MFS transporter [Bacillus]
MIVRKVLGDVPLTKDLKLLLVIGGLFSISAALSNTFVNIFLWKQSGSFLEIGVYNITIVLLQLISFVLAGRLAKVMDRVIVLRMGVLFLAIFYLVVLFVGDFAAKYIVLLGAIQGIGSGLYWLAYNVLTFEITEPENRDFFNGFLGILNSIGGMVGPFTAGFIISHLVGNTGYSVIFAISMMLFAIAVIMSFFINRRHAKGKFYVWTIIKERRNSSNWKNITNAHIFQGLREGTFFFIVSLFIFISTGSELALGTFGLINSGIGLLTYYCVSRFVKKKNRNKAILIGSIGLFISIFFLLFHVTYFNLLMYGVAIAFFYPLLLVPYFSLTYDVIGRSWKAAEMRVEYIVVKELFLNIGRALSIFIFLICVSFLDIVRIMPYLLIFLGSGHMMIYFYIRKITLDTPTV